MPYQPSDKILEKYAKVLIDFALGSENGIKPHEVVFLQVPECAKPILFHLRRAVLKSGGYPIIQYIPDEMMRDFFKYASDDQLSFFPEKYLKGKVDQMDHVVGILAETDKHELEGIDPKKIMLSQRALKPYKDWRDQKENQGKLTWTLALYGTPAMAKEVGMSLKDYWDQIIAACYLDTPDPIATWQKTAREVNRLKNELNALQIESLHIEAQDTDLVVGLGKNRKWLGGGGRNIPSFEVFVSPDWRETHGKVFFNEPLYAYGNLVKDVHLEFKKGRVVKVSAKKGEKVLQEMIKVENADKIGEYSLTDSRLSRITKFMGETLFDENVGGKFGNTHMALGSAYKDAYTGDPAQVTEAGWHEMGYNESVIHTDIVQSIDRVVTATLPSGAKKVIYKSGKFTI
ncbi:aminopeptidase [Candidatus Microgenomates bacterium]|nr:MAG: aminopeptidase [Candidatus Microgenomates bacterium]